MGLGTAQKVKHANHTTGGKGLHVLALVTDAFGGYGGIAQYNQDLLGALAAQSEISEITILPRLGPKGDIEPHAGVRQRRAVANRAAYSAMALAEAIRYRPHVVFSGHLYQGPLALAVARLCGAKLVSQLHGTEIWKPASQLQLVPLEKSDLVLCVSRDTKSRYEDQAKDASNAIVVANTVGNAFTTGDQTAARARLGISNQYALLTVGRLDKREGYKGHDRLIAAMPHVVGPGRRELIYLIAGIGDDRARLEQLAQEKGVADRVRFLGKVPHETLPDVYRAADLFALPSTGEGFGIVFLEAMACGTPAFGLAMGGSPDALGGGELGILATRDDDFVSALQTAILTPTPDRKHLSDAVRRRFGAQAFRRRVAQAMEILHSSGT